MKIVKPKCPGCGKVVAEWVKEAGFTCPRCGTSFVILEDKPSITELVLDKHIKV